MPLCVTFAQCSKPLNKVIEDFDRKSGVEVPDERNDKSAKNQD